MNKTKICCIALAGLLALCGVLLFWQNHQKITEAVAVVYQDNQPIYQVDLSAVEIPFTYSVGGNTILFEHGRVCMESADCPDQICVNSGWRSDSVTPIVCLPNRIMIRLQSGQQSIDTEVG